MRNILLLLLTLSFTFASSQIYTSRTIEIEQGQMDKFIEAASKKTQMFNNDENNFAYYTFQILSGEDTGKIFRVQVGTPEMMDAGLDQKEANYWSKNVGPYIKSNSAGRTVMWWRNADASFVPESSSDNDLRMVMFYNYKDEGEVDFWRFSLIGCHLIPQLHIHGCDHVNTEIQIVWQPVCLFSWRSKCADVDSAG